MPAIAALLALLVAAEAPAVRYPRRIVVPPVERLHDHGRATEHGWRAHDETLAAATAGIALDDDPLGLLGRLVRIECAPGRETDACPDMLATLALRSVMRASYFRAQARALAE